MGLSDGFRSSQLQFIGLSDVCGLEFSQQVQHRRVVASLGVLKPRHFRGLLLSSSYTARTSSLVTSANPANSMPRSSVMVLVSGWPPRAAACVSATSFLVWAGERPPSSRRLARSTSVTRQTPAPLPTAVSPSQSPRRSRASASAGLSDIGLVPGILPRRSSRPPLRCVRFPLWRSLPLRPWPSGAARVGRACGR